MSALLGLVLLTRRCPLSVPYGSHVGNCSPGGGAGPRPRRRPYSASPSPSGPRPRPPDAGCLLGPGPPHPGLPAPLSAPHVPLGPRAASPPALRGAPPDLSHPRLIPGGLWPPGRYSRPSSPASSRVLALYPKGLPRRCRLRGCWRRRRLEVPAAGPGPAGRTARTRRRGRWARRVWR